MQNALAQLELELAPGERVLWSGVPKQGIVFSAVDLFAIPFALLWLGIATSFELMVLRTPPHQSSAMRVVLVLFGIPFILVGLYLLIGRHFADARKRSRTVYGITNQRILTITSGRTRRVRSFDLNDVSDVDLIEKRDQSGTLRIHLSNSPIIINAGREQRYPASGGHIFDAVPRVRLAYDALMQARADSSRLPA